MAIHSSLLAWRIPWTEETAGLQFTGSQRARHDLSTKQQDILRDECIFLKINFKDNFISE